MSIWDDDKTYYARRAREEREYAAKCEDNCVAVVHLRMADQYAARARAIVAAPPKLRMV